MTVFCDWFSAYQEHPQGGLPRINDGAVWCVNEHGEVEWTTERQFVQVGSFETKIRIKCDGYRVKLDGNIGRYNRPDNVFGFSVLDCIGRANDLLARFGLPPFTQAQFNPNNGGMALGAVITRVDLTKNYSTGSHKKAVRLVHYFAGQDAGRRATVKQYGDNGVTWNEGSKYQSSKLYLKSEALGQHCPDALGQWVREQGIARHEITLKARYLRKNNLRHIQDWQAFENGRVISMDNVIYGQFSEVLTRGSAVRTQLDDIPKRLGHLALSWQTGKDLWGSTEYCRQTKARWRKQLLPYGIDIKQPSSAVRLNTRVEIITLQEVQVPDWYWREAA